MGWIPTEWCLDVENLTSSTLFSMWDEDQKSSKPWEFPGFNDPNKR
jgi:hypothetical protein